MRKENQRKSDAVGTGMEVPREVTRTSRLQKKKSGFRFFRDGFPVLLLLAALVFVGIGSAYVRAQNADYEVMLEVFKGDASLIEGIGFAQEIFNEDNRARWSTQTRYLGTGGTDKTADLSGTGGANETLDLSGSIVKSNTFRYYSDGYSESTYYSTVELTIDDTYIRTALGVDTTPKDDYFYAEYRISDTLNYIPLEPSIRDSSLDFRTEAVNDDILGKYGEKYPVRKVPEDAFYVIEQKKGNSSGHGSTISMRVDMGGIPYLDFSGETMQIGDRLYFTISTAIPEYTSRTFQDENGEYTSEEVRAEYGGTSGLYSIDLAAYQEARHQGKWGTVSYAEPEIELLYPIAVSSEQDFQILELSVVSEKNGGRLMLVGREQADIILFYFDGNGNLLSKNRYENILPSAAKGCDWESYTFASEAGDTWFYVTKSMETGKIGATAWSLNVKDEWKLLGNKTADPQEFEEYSFGRRILTEGTVWDAAWHNGEICLLMTGNQYVNRKHETSAYLLIPGESESAFFGRFYNTMDEDGSIAAEKPEFYGINIGRYGCDLHFLE